MWGQVLSGDPNFVDRQSLFLWLIICSNNTPCALSAGQGSAATGQTVEADLHHEKRNKIHPFTPSSRGYWTVESSQRSLTTKDILTFGWLECAKEAHNMDKMYVLKAAHSTVRSDFHKKRLKLIDSQKSHNYCRFFTGRHQYEPHVLLGLMLLFKQRRSIYPHWDLIALIHRICECCYLFKRSHTYTHTRSLATVKRYDSFHEVVHLCRSDSIWKISLNESTHQ